MIDRLLVYKYFKYWWFSIVAYLVPFGVFYIGTLLRRDIIIDLSILLFLINFLGCFVSAVIQLIEGKWYFFIFQFLISIYLFLNVSLVASISLPDYYGAHKVIPKGIDIFNPLNEDSDTNELVKNEFIILNYGQPGNYRFYTKLELAEVGILYLKIYELTSNDRLSDFRVAEESKIEIEKVGLNVYTSSFTIYEGSWGDKYGARIELWFEPKNGNEYKVLEKNYIIEGWMR